MFVRRFKRVADRANQELFRPGTRDVEAGDQNIITGADAISGGNIDQAAAGLTHVVSGWGIWFFLLV